MAEETFRIRVRGLVDADQADEQVDGVEHLPVCMIENLLLAPESIFEYMQGVARDTFADSDAVRDELRSIATEMRSKEITLRLRRRLKPKLVRLSGATVDEIKASLVEQVAGVQAILPSDDRLNEIVAETTAAVDAIIAADQQLDQFRGKELLNTFYQRHVAALNIGYNPMCIDLARIVAQRQQVAARLDPVFDRLIAD
ncbi:MAG TPA: hypothetical protein VN814_19215 [Caulobacteraceae bacterium]|nr:hypothetical protein [Caulobacteraceae bacterium]